MTRGPIDNKAEPGSILGLVRRYILRLNQLKTSTSDFLLHHSRGYLQPWMKRHRKRHGREREQVEEERRGENTEKLRQKNREKFHKNGREIICGCGVYIGSLEFGVQRGVVRV